MVWKIIAVIKLVCTKELAGYITVSQLLGISLMLGRSIVRYYSKRATPVL
jgi:hypothetical protein